MNTNPSSESIPDRFARAVARFAARPAVNAPAGRWTYAELDRRSNFIAAEILERLGENSEPVALLMVHDAPLIAAIFGALKANKIYLALDPDHPPEQLAAMLASSGAKLLLADLSNLPLANSLASGQLKIFTVAQDLSGDAPRRSFPGITGEASAWLMFTSGSTNAPKGVWQNHHGLVREAEIYAELIQLTLDDRVSLLTACGLSASGATLFAALLHGATLCPFHVRSQGIERLVDWLRSERITIFHSVPTIFRHLARAANGKNSFESVRLVRLGGEPVLRGDVEIFRRLCPDNCRLVQSLSSTETGIISAFTMDKQTFLPDQRVPVGYAVQGVDIFLVDEKNQPLKNSSEGKIAVRSARLRQGYWRQPELTAEIFLIDDCDPNLRIFVSNDMGRFLPDGSLEHLGRTDQLVKIRGQRVDLGEVEAALLATELVKEAAVTAPEDASGERRLVAYFVPRVEADATPKNFRRVLRGQLPEHMIPNDFVPLEELPQTAAGKIDRRALAHPPRMTKSVASKGPMPRYSIEQKLAQIWREVLNLPKIGRQHDFFDLGGTSLQSAQILTKIEEAFNVILPASTLAEHSTIEALALLLADRTISQSDSPLVVLRMATTGRPLFFMHNGMGEVSTYGQLARRLPNRPIYGLQARGLRGESWPIMRIPDMVRSYLPAVIAADSTGPYLLAGTCTGALVAFEMAQQLVQSGRSVGLVALFDSPTPPFSGQRSRWSELTMDRVRDAFRILRWSIMHMMGLARTPRWLPAYRHFVSAMTGRAWHLYRPVSYPGKLTLFQTAAKFPKEDRRAMMAKYACETQTITIPGNRVGLFVPPAVDELARQLQICLAHAEGKGLL
ncbi:MAG: AMP-binding protein [Verrucomicrobiota bacterium]